jgi:S-disulfanyl-L-cysteine oxidoreductase SoxD
MNRTTFRCAAFAMCAGLVACGTDAGDPGASAVRTDTTFAHATTTFAPTGAPPDEFARAGGEPRPARFGIGRAATQDEIARLDIDVMPDGTGLPPGSATPRDGAPIYAAKCAACHGVDGTGGSELALVAQGEDKHAFTTGEDFDAFAARTVGNYWPYATTLFDYIRRSMPFDRPGSLTDVEVYALTAWLLWQNDIIAEGDVIDASSLPRVEMPAHSRFIIDDRPTSTRVR